MDKTTIKSSLEDLIEICRDGHKGYQDAAAHVKRGDLKTYFLEQSLERGRFAEELQRELQKMGDPDKKVEGTVVAALHRAWIDAKASLGGGDKTILDSVETGEDSARESYQKVLSSDSLPGDLADIIRTQASSVQQAHDKVKTLRDTAEAA